MMASFDHNSQKLQQVLQLFLLPDYNIVTNTYLDLLLTHIAGELKNENQIITKTVNDWLILAFNAWNESSKPCTNVSIFTIKLIGVISESAVSFNYLDENGIHDKTCLLFELTKNNLPASIKMAFVTMFLNFIEHPSGRHWIEKTGAWKEVLKFAQANHTMYVTRESRQFLAKLLIKECNNKQLCEEIILAVTDPLVKATDNSPVESNHMNFSKSDLFHQNNLLSTTIELITSILDYTIFYDMHNPIPTMFEELTSLENRVKVVFEVSISTPLMKPVHILSKLLIFSALRISLQTADSISEQVFDQFCARLCYTSTLLLSKKYILDLVISKKLGVIYWNRLKKLKYIEAPKWFKFENQAIAVMILPLYVTLKPKYMKTHFLFEDFIEKLFDVTCTAVQRLAYNARDVILKNDFPMEMICKSTIDHLLEIVDVIDREAAVIVFQSFCHSLKNFVCESKQAKENEKSMDSSNELNSANSPTNIQMKLKQPYTSFLDGDPINDKKLLLAALLNGLNVFTEKFKLKWQECVETICMLSIAQDILNHPGVDSKICTLALKTSKLAIQNFLPPNLALLVDVDDHTKEIGSTLFKRIHDTNWEVQDSVLEVLITITYLSENKYPPYQMMLLDNQFLQVAIEIVKGDNEIYVRASALSFISTAVRINTLWDKLLCQLQLPDLAMKLVYHESEAVVRREAVTLIKELYDHRKWPKTLINAMSHAMTVAAVLDLDWEVKRNALEFWRHFIKSHLTDQGMLDGHFPSMTFSKENRKIVSLDETEIKQRLNKALDELSRQRCLGVLLVTLKDESDLEVSKTSANIISDLRRILLNYKINEPMPEQPLAKDTPTIDTSYKKRPEIDSNNTTNTLKTSDNIIENIVDETDANLLASIYRDSMKMDGDEIERSGKEILEYVGKIDREEFLRTILGFDLEKYIRERTEWLQNYTTSFDSVLEDIILVNDKKDVNVMDCY